MLVTAVLFTWFFMETLVIILDFHMCFLYNNS